MGLKLLYSFIAFVILHIFVWFSTNLQFISEAWKEKSMWVCLSLSIPISLLAYFGARFGYYALGESAWGVRFLAFGTSYLIFPILTWYFLGEPMLTLKTMLCIFLSCIIISIQMWM